MKLKNVKQVNDFLEAVNACKDEVYLTSIYGDKYNLKSTLSQYVAIGALLGEHGDELELFCLNKQDEGTLLEFFYNNPEVVDVSL